MTNSLTECNICSNKKFKVIDEKYLPYKLLKCLNCGLVFVNPQPEKIDQHYNDEYFRPWISQETRKSRERIFEKRWKKIKNFFKNKKGRILDIGCGCGEFLFFAKKDGWDVYGTEISDFSKEYVSKTYDIEIPITDDITKLSFPDEFFDVITLWHVLEHLTDPKKTLVEVSRITKRDGLLVIAIPNLKNYIEDFLYRIVKFKKMEIFNPEMRELHLYHFDSSTIKRLLNETGFDIIKETVDLGIPQFGFRLLSLFALLIFYLTGLNFGSAIEIFAKKK